MRNLYLLRHAKSSWDDPSPSDIDRPLNRRGQRDAPKMGVALGARLDPMTFHVSPAERAQSTFRLLQKNWKGLKQRHGVTEPALYTFDYREVLAWIAVQSPQAERLAVVGHNPALTDVINYLVGAETLDNLPTSGWVELALGIEDWSAIHRFQSQGQLVYRLFPKELSGTD